MLKPLTEEQIERIIETAIGQFAEKGYAGANVNRIASLADVSVGVIYKYYQDKEGLFLACVRRSLDFLDSVFEQTRSRGGSLMEMIEDLIRRAQQAAREHPAYFQMYHHITVMGAPAEHDVSMAEMIEGSTARLYKGLLESASDKGEIRRDLDPAFFALFFDNLMMMLHFSYACSYYRERYRIYCGEAVPEDEAADEKVRKQLLSYIGGALGA